MRSQANSSICQPLGLFGRIFKGYEQLIHSIIRPPRAKYTIEQLGPCDFTFLGQRFLREDVELDTGRRRKSKRKNKNKEGGSLKLQASLWTRQHDQDRDGDRDGYTQKTFVVYLHGNASARVEVVPYLSFLLASGVFGVCSLDFCGSGQSDGDYVSLGYYEQHDLDVVLAYLQQRYGDALEVVLWGRSMGASTALMHAGQKTQAGMPVQAANGTNPMLQPETTSSHVDMPRPKLKGLICDSPFASLPQLCQEMVEKARSKGLVVPAVIENAGVAMIGRSVSKLAKFSIHDVAPIKHAATIDTPTLFVVGADDDFIPPHHAEGLCANYGKGVSTNLFMVPGGHNHARPELVFEAVSQFLGYRLSNNHVNALPVPAGMKERLHQMPPWVYATWPRIFMAHKIKPDTSPANISGSATDHLTETLGMTQRRQDDIQNKLHQMFGQVKVRA